MTWALYCRAVDERTTVVAVCVGPVKVRQGGRGGGVWESAFEKHPVAGPRRLTVTGFVGDAQADRRFHGGPEKAALLYCGDYYPAWRADHDWPEAGPGALGENVTLAGVGEAEVCVGDVWRIGGAIVEVSQPRAPCWKIDARWQKKGLTAAVARNGRTGWYVRVKQEGDVAEHDVMTLAERPHVDWPIARINEVALAKRARAAEWSELVALRALSREFVG